MLLRIDHPELTTVIDTPLKLGEGPCWSAAENALYFVDILAPKLYRLDLASKALRGWAMPSDIGSFGLAKDGRMVVALRDGV
jgi:sugar lactone lactonase YvrE